MKNIGKIAVLGAVLAASGSYAFADVITLGSWGAAGLSGYNPVVTVSNTEVKYVANTTYANDTTGCGAGTYCLPAFGGLGSLTAVGPTNAVELNPISPSIWQGPLTNSSWVGINANAGPDTTSNPAFGYYEFTTTFNTTASNYGGFLTVYADDTVAVWLNGSQIIPFGVLGGDGHCADNKPTCSVTDTVAISAANGANTLTFVVEQGGLGPAGGNNDPSGFDFSATLAPTPEPSSLMLLGTGLVGAAGMLFRRRRVTV